MPLRGLRVSLNGNINGKPGWSPKVNTPSTPPACTHTNSSTILLYRIGGRMKTQSCWRTAKHNRGVKGHMCTQRDIHEFAGTVDGS